MKVTLISADGDARRIEVEDGFTIAEVFEAADKYLGGGRVSLNGEPADADTPVEEGDVVAEAKTAEGG